VRLGTMRTKEQQSGNLDPAPMLASVLHAASCTGRGARTQHPRCPGAQELQ
jgi:hypothetical protein